MWQGGGMHGKGVCMCMAGGHVWKGVCMAYPPTDTTRYGDTVNERAVRILLECILVYLKYQKV